MRDDENRLVAEPKKDRGQRRLQIASIGKVLDFDLEADFTRGLF